MEGATSISSHQPPANILQILDLINRVQKLTVNALQVKDLQGLVSIILNETKVAMQYDRAILFHKKNENMEILGVVENQPSSEPSDISSLKPLVKSIENSASPQILSVAGFGDQRNLWQKMQATRFSTVYWAPIIHGSKEEVGLWLEKYDDANAKKYFETYSPILKEFLLPAYATAWEKISSASLFSKIIAKINLKKSGLIVLGLLLLLLFIPVRLRVVAPCEVVAKEHYVVTAPMEGIIKSIAVEPGQKVQKDQLIFSYDDKVSLSQYEAALKNVELLQTEVDRSYVLGMEKSEEITQLTALIKKLEKSQVELAFAKQRLGLTIDKAPIAGLVSVDNPNSWRGKPVKTGEKIMTISNPEQTKLKIWIPEKDNVFFHSDLVIQVFLNPFPGKTFEAKLLYVSNESKIKEDQLPYFEAEAEWVNLTETPNLGLKGSAVLYGEKVSLFYYLVRKPLAIMRKLIGF